MRKILAIVLVLTATPAWAETAYVSERLPIALRAAFAEGSPVVKVVEGGTPLEVLERADKFARVRDNQGAEGWIEARFLSAAPPARPVLERTQAELAKAAKDLAEANARVKQLEAAVAQQSAHSAELAKTVEQAKVQTPAEAAAPAPEAADFPWGWLVLAFAMLGFGFGAGVVWVRERNRKKLGGMYLRI